MKMVWKHMPYVWLVFGFLFSSLAFQVRGAKLEGLYCIPVPSNITLTDGSTGKTKLVPP